jgi:hypothetical protein
MVIEVGAKRDPRYASDASATAEGANAMRGDQTIGRRIATSATSATP